MDLFQHFREKFKTEEFLEAQSEVALDNYRDVLFSTRKLGWSSVHVQYEMSEWLEEQYACHIKTPSKVSDGIHFFKRGNITGFAIQPGYFPFEEPDLKMLFDHLRDRVLLLPYYVYLSETRTKNREEWVEVSHIHKLHPDEMRDDRGRYIQQFGHINIEMTEKDSRVANLEFICHAQTGAAYTRPLPFEMLMQVLTGS